MEHCRMKGFLSFLLLWSLSKRSMTGVEIALELKKKERKKTESRHDIPIIKTYERGKFHFN